MTADPYALEPFWARLGKSPAPKCAICKGTGFATKIENRVIHCGIHCKCGLGQRLKVRGQDRPCEIEDGVTEYCRGCGKLKREHPTYPYNPDTVYDRRVQGP